MVPPRAPHLPLPNSRGGAGPSRKGVEWRVPQGSFWWTHCFGLFVTAQVGAGLGDVRSKQDEPGMENPGRRWVRMPKILASRAGRGLPPTWLRGRVTLLPLPGPLAKDYVSQQAQERLPVPGPARSLPGVGRLAARERRLGCSVSCPGPSRVEASASPYGLPGARGLAVSGEWG